MRGCTAALDTKNSYLQAFTRFIFETKTAEVVVGDEQNGAGNVGTDREGLNVTDTTCSLQNTATP